MRLKYKALGVCCYVSRENNKLMFKLVRRRKQECGQSSLPNIRDASLTGLPCHCIHLSVWGPQSPSAAGGGMCNIGTVPHPNVMSQKSVQAHTALPSAIVACS